MNALISIVLFPFRFLFGLAPKKKNLWLFGAWAGNRYADNSAVFYEYLLRETDQEVVWCTKNKEPYAMKSE